MGLMNPWGYPGGNCTEQPPLPWVETRPVPLGDSHHSLAAQCVPRAPHGVRYGLISPSIPKNWRRKAAKLALVAQQFACKGAKLPHAHCLPYREIRRPIQKHGFRSFRLSKLDFLKKLSEIWRICRTICCMSFPLWYYARRCRDLLCRGKRTDFSRSLNVFKRLI